MVRHLVLFLVPEEDFLVSHKFWQVIDRLHNIEALSLIRARWNYDRWQQDKDQFVNLFQNIVSLDLSLCEYDTEDHFLSFISAFPSLAELSLNDTTWCDDWVSSSWTPPPIADTPGKQVRSLKVDGDLDGSLDFLGFIAKWFAQLLNVTTHGVALDWQAEYPPEAFPVLLRGVGRSLAYLKINVIHESPLDLSSSGYLEYSIAKLN